MRMMLILLACVAASPALAGPHEDALAAYSKGDYETTVRLLRPLAEQGDAREQDQLGSMYQHGQGVTQDDKEAVLWFAKAAAQGNLWGEFHLALMYLVGKGVPSNSELAASWMRKAAEQGFPFALSALGVMYERGHGVPQDNVQAYKWCSLAADNLDVAMAKKEHETAVRNRDAIAAKMTAAQIAEAQKLAREWTPTREK